MIEDEGYILHGKPYREKTIVYDFLSEHRGRYRFLLRQPAHSVYSKKSKKTSTKPQNGQIFFRKVWIQYRKLDICQERFPYVRSLETYVTQENFERLSGKTLYAAFYIHELLLRLLPEKDHHNKWSVLYKKTLTNLSQNKPLEPTLRNFELDFLTLLGHALPNHQIEHIQSRKEKHYFFDDTHGFLPCSSAQIHTHNALTGYDKTHLAYIARRDFSNPLVCITAKRLMRDILSHFLGDRPLKSRALFKASL